jgi:hypothetical protein
MEFYFLNWVQVSYGFGKVVPSGTTQGISEIEKKSLSRELNYG